MNETVKAEADPRQRAGKSGRSGAWLWCARSVGLVLLTLGSWWLVDRGLGRWVIWVAGLAAQWQPHGSEHHALAPLNAVGRADAPLQLVLACDLAEQRCRQRLHVLMVWQARHADDARLVLLQRPRDANRALAQAVQAAGQQALLWPMLAQLYDRTGDLDSSTVAEAVRTLRGHPVRWQRDAAEADAALQVGAERTMATALGLDDDAALLVSGLPATPTELSSESATTTALEQAWTTLRQRIAHHRGDVGAAQLECLQSQPLATRERYIAWILHGQRAPSLRIRSSSPAQQR